LDRLLLWLVWINRFSDRFHRFISRHCDIISRTRTFGLHEAEVLNYKEVNNYLLLI
jgi:hypothetical protein